MGQKSFASLVAAVFLYIAFPLLFPILMGGILAVLFMPWLERLEKKKISTQVGAGVLTLGITVVIILPTALLLFFIARTGLQHLKSWKSLPATVTVTSGGGGFFDAVFNMPRVHNLMVWVTNRVPVEMTDLSNSFHDLANSIGTRLTELLGGMLGQLPGMAMGLLVVVLSTYFLLVDGRKLVHYFHRNTIFTTQQTNQLIRTVAEMCRSVILASLVSGAAQAILEFFGCVFTGIPDAPLIGLLVFIASFIPVVGSAPITFGVALHQFVEGHQGKGIALLVMAIVVVSVDNFIRPWFLRGAANLHPLLAFVAAFGGLQTLGFLGVFFGPIIAALFVATVQILLQEEKTIELG